MDPKEERPDREDATQALDPQAIERLIRSLREVGSNLGGWRIGSYRLVEEIGRGSMGIVFLARHETLLRDVALKVLPGSAALDPQSRERFLREARVMARIVHPGVVQIHDVIEDHGSLAIAMERIEGMSLAGLIAELRTRRADGPPSLEHLAAALGIAADQLPARSYVDWVARVGRDLAEALQAVHDCELTHRDLKPSNVLVDRTGRALLADFGVVRELDGSRTATGGFVGTAAYAAPEQLRGEPDVDSRADLYGLGATLYEMLALVPPVSGSPATILGSVERGAVPPLRRRAVAPTTPSLALIVHHALEPERDRRYQTALAMAADLQACRESRPISVQASTRLERIALWARREPTKARLAGVLAVAALALVAVGGYLVAQLPRIEAVERQEFARRVDDLVATGRALQMQPSTRTAGTKALADAVALDPEHPIALGVYVLQLAGEGRTTDAREALERGAALVAREPGLRHLRDTGIELFQRPPQADRALLETGTDPLECFLGALALVARAEQFHAEDLRRQEFRDATALFDRAVRMSDPVPRIFRIELAGAAARAGLGLSARDQLRALETCWTGDPTDDSPAVALRAVSALLELKDAAAAEAICATPAFGRSDHIARTSLVAAVLRAAGRTEAAVALLEAELRSMDGTGTDLRHRLAQMLPDDDPRRRELLDQVVEDLSALAERMSASGRRPSAVHLQIHRLRYAGLEDLDERLSYLNERCAQAPDDWMLRAELAAEMMFACAKTAYWTHSGLLKLTADPNRSSQDIVNFVRRRSKLPLLEELVSVSTEHLEAAMREVPFHPNVARNMAVHYALFRGDDEAGRQHFDRFAILVPSEHSPDLFRGILSLRTGDRDSAKAALERSHRSILLQLGGDVARATFPHDGHGTLPATLLGWLLVDEGRPLDAARFFDEALEIAELPDDTELPSFRHWRRNLHLGKALVSLRSGAGPDALAEADRWIETASTEPHAFGLDAAVRAARSLAAGDRETARRELRIARRGRELARELAVTDQNFDAVLPRTIGLIDEIEAALGR